jgi:hypothetical protein
MLSLHHDRETKQHNTLNTKLDPLSEGGFEPPHFADSARWKKTHGSWIMSRSASILKWATGLFSRLNYSPEEIQGD